MFPSKCESITHFFPQLYPNFFVLCNILCGTMMFFVLFPSYAFSVIAFSRKCTFFPVIHYSVLHFFKTLIFVFWILASSYSSLETSFLVQNKVILLYVCCANQDMQFAILNIHIGSFFFYHAKDCIQKKGLIKNIENLNFEKKITITLQSNNLLFPKIRKNNVFGRKLIKRRTTCCYLKIYIQCKFKNSYLRKQLNV